MIRPLALCLLLVACMYSSADAVNTARYLKRFTAQCNHYSGPPANSETGKACSTSQVSSLCSHMKQALRTDLQSERGCTDSCRHYYGTLSISSGCAPWKEYAMLQCKRVCGKIY